MEGPQVFIMTRMRSSYLWLWDLSMERKQSLAKLHNKFCLSWSRLKKNNNGIEMNKKIDAGGEPNPEEPTE